MPTALITLLDTSRQNDAAYFGRLVRYDPDTGKMYWRHRDREFFSSDRSASTWNKRFAGRVFGSINPDGYVAGRINSQSLRAHRVAWLLMTGEWPAGQIDHINGDRSDNRWINLRVASSSENSRNRALLPGISGVTGVTWHSQQKKWQARICLNRRRVSLGVFPTIEAAASARMAAAQSNGFTPRHGVSK